MKVSITEEDNGADAFEKKLEEMSGSFVTIGIHSDEADHPKGISMVELGTIHEFGTEHIPARSFIRATFDANRARLGAQMLALEAKLVTSKGIRVADVLDRMGLIFKADVQNAISNRIPPPLKEATILAKKGKSVPLINTGKLRSSIDYKVTV